MSDSRRWRLLLLGVFLLALAVRIAILLEGAGAPYHRFLVLDAATYHRIALAGDPSEPFWQPPLYPWFLRGLYALAGGPSPTLARLVQALAGALTAVMTALIARRFAGPAPAAAAGVAIALYAPLATLDAELLPASLATGLVTAFVLTLLSPAGGGSPGWWRRLRLPVAGALLGAAGILLPPLGLPAALALAWLVRREGWRPALLVGLIALVPVAGVTLRNRSYERSLVPVSWNGGTNLWIGNNPDYPETVGIRPGVRWTRLMEAPRCESGAATRAAESAWFAARARAFALADPLQFAGNLIWKAAAAVSAREIGRNRDDYDARDESTRRAAPALAVGLPVHRALPARGGGNRGARARPRDARALAAPLLPLLVALGVLAVSVVFFPSARYRAPAIPMLVVLAAAGLPRARAHAVAAAAAGAAALALTLVPHGIRRSRPGKRSTRSRSTSTSTGARSTRCRSSSRPRGTLPTTPTSRSTSASCSASSSAARRPGPSSSERSRSSPTPTPVGRRWPSTGSGAATGAGARDDRAGGRRQRLQPAGARPLRAGPDGRGRAGGGAAPAGRGRARLPASRRLRRPGAAAAGAAQRPISACGFAGAPPGPSPSPPSPAP